ncbi:unnamed protein product [Cunninghamella echinulata]
MVKVSSITALILGSINFIQCYSSLETQSFQLSTRDAFDTCMASASYEIKEPPPDIKPGRYYILDKVRDCLVDAGKCPYGQELTKCPLSSQVDIDTSNKFSECLSVVIDGGNGKTPDRAKACLELTCEIECIIQDIH